MGNGVDLKPSISPTAMRSRLRSTAGMRSRRQCLELADDEFVDLFLVGDGHAKQVLGKAAHLRLDLVAGLPEGGAHLVGDLLADVRLEEHLHGEFARLAPRPGRHAVPPSVATAPSLRRRLTISIAAAGRFKSLVAGLDAGAVERLLQRFAGKHAKAVGNAGLLLRLPDAARHFVVDGLVVRRFAAQQAAERDDGIDACPASPGSAPLPGFPMRRERAPPRYRCAARRCAASASSAPSSRRSVMTAFQRATTMANFMPSAERSPSTATGLPFSGSVHAQKLKANPGSGAAVKMRDFQCGFSDRRERARPRLRRPACSARPEPPGAPRRAL